MSSAARFPWLVALPALVAALGCQTQPPRPEATLHYVGSSTVAVFLREAEPVYGAIEFELDTLPESEGGERAILAGEADLAGIATRPRIETLRAGVVATLIGRDAIAVIVNARNPITNLSSEDLRRIFSGEVENWREVAGPDLTIEPFIVGPESATRRIFGATVLGGADYAGCEEVRPDEDILAAVAGADGGIGQISLSFLEHSRGIRPVSVDGEVPSSVNLDYPITRPLHLLWREGRPAIERFVDWTQSDEGQRLVMRHFIGARVLGAVKTTAPRTQPGLLVVYTETYPFNDGGIYYYPHRPYELLDRRGVRVRRVPNHRGANDEQPTRIRLAAGTYVVRAETSKGEQVEFFVTIESGKLTELDLAELVKYRQ